MHNIATLIPAAGASSRMRGDDKLTQIVDGLPLLRRQAEMALAAGTHVTVTLPSFDHPRTKVLAGLPVQIVPVPDSDLGMSASIRRGVAFLPRDTTAVMILPADMPDIGRADLEMLIAAYRAAPFASLQQATSQDGTPGHPVLFPQDCFPALQALTGDQGARDVVAANANRLRRIALPDKHALTDLDTPEAWDAWRATHREKQPVSSEPVTSNGCVDPALAAHQVR